MTAINRVSGRCREVNWFFLHPEANLVYADNATEEYDLSVTVEALGYEAFDFGSDGRVEGWWGVSLLAAYLPKPGGNESDWSTGLLFKYQGYSLGVTDNHGDTGLVFNINLAQKLFNLDQDARNYFDEFKP